MFFKLSGSQKQFIFGHIVNFLLNEFEGENYIFLLKITM